MKTINIETLMGHSLGTSDSYYRITEQDLLKDYLKAGPGVLTINSTEKKLRIVLPLVSKLRIVLPLVSI